MTTLEAKPVKAKKLLNTRLLPIAALLLVLLALLFLAAPLIRASGGSARAGNFVPPGNGQTLTQSGASGQATGNQFFVGGSGGTSGATRRIVVGAGGGRVTVIIYFVALLIALAAALGMLFTKRWGVVLAIIMAVLYGLFGLVSLLPLLVGVRNPVSLILGVVHLLMAVAVIVLASIPGKPAVPATGV